MNKGAVWSGMMLLTLLFVIPLTLAATESIVNINSPYQGYGLVVRVKDGSTVLQNIYNKTDADGKATISFSTSLSEVTFTLMFVDGEGQVVQTKTFEDVPVQDVMELTFGKAGASENTTTSTNATNSTEPVTNITENSGNQSSVTGNAILSKSDVHITKQLWVVIGVIVLFIGALIAMKVGSMKMSGHPRAPLTPPGSTKTTLPAHLEPIAAPATASVTDLDSELLDVDKKIKETEEQLLRAKRDKLSRVQRAYDNERVPQEKTGNQSQNQPSAQKSVTPTKETSTADSTTGKSDQNKLR